MFDLDKIKLDSDKDGLTDILEIKLNTDPNNIDTDGDGIEDLEDKNPLSIKNESEFTEVCNYLLNYHIYSCFIQRDIEPKCKLRYEENDIHRTYMIVSDDPLLKSIKPINHRLLILTKEEFELYQKLHPVSVERKYVSPLFKVDNLPDTYKITIGGRYGIDYYLIQKINEGWKIVWTGGSIS